jgi:alkylhydroperoxidase family enzyme
VFWAVFKGMNDQVHFSEAEIAVLTLAVAMINSWNRLNVALRTEAGGYRPGMFNGLTGQ